jgi:dCMP deaminase
MLSAPTKWDLRFMELAQVVSSWSKDPSTKVGSVIADKKHIVSVGFNGFPAGVEDREEWLNNRETKLRLITHAEINAILNARCSVRVFTVYLYPIFPCPDCAKHLGAAGISRVVTRMGKGVTSKYLETLETTKTVLDHMGIKFDVYDDQA